MNDKIFKILEYQKIIDRLESYATSDPGREICRNLKPAIELEEIQNIQAETTSARKRIEYNHEISFRNVTDIKPSVESLEDGNSITAAELLRICELLETVVKVKKYGCREIPEEKRDRLDHMFNSLQSYPKLIEEIRRCIATENMINDNASSGLADVRKKIKRASEGIRDKLNAMISGSARNYLQEPNIVERDGVYCLPVKYACRNKVNGIAHGQSGTGSTLFIEPQAINKLNQEISSLQEREKIEIAIVLSNLSELARQHTKYLKRNLETLAKLDFIFAKAFLSENYKGTEPIFNKKGYINIVNGRHPLIDPEKVVPSNIELGKNYDLLVITGPNTGGKTLTMKTTGLLTMMGQSGLHIPAMEGTELSVFKEIFADIGDEQSIEQSLSTFSAHMTNIVSILKEVDTDSLVLIDELGSGTDPEEGAALAISILSKLHRQKIRTLATTHYSELKTFAVSTEGVENACCEFNVETLSPTYRLIIGKIGESNAFAISKKLGLEDDIIEDARKYIDEFDKNFKN